MNPGDRLGQEPDLASCSQLRAPQLRLTPVRTRCLRPCRKEITHAPLLAWDHFAGYPDPGHRPLPLAPRLPAGPAGHAGRCPAGLTRTGMVQARVTLCGAKQCGISAI